MIGVIANPSDRAVVAEFFELFKTPWEFYRRDRKYKVVLCDGVGNVDDLASNVAVIYAGGKLPDDPPDSIGTAYQCNKNRSLAYKGMRIPIYGRSVTFREKGSRDLVDAESQEPAAYLDLSSGRVLARIGYDLFCEVRTLLTVGQPASNAAIPTLDLHIALLRDLIIASGTSLVEIPPVPGGYRFIACLTHDVDQPSIRQHKFDHTMFGFLYRATFRSLVNLLRGRANCRQLLKNWAAALRLPFVHLGLARDFWREFDRYPELEAGYHSSFFIIPFKDDPGRRGGRRAPKRRASRYGARDIVGSLQTLMSAGCEIGLHGIDAWCDGSKGREELKEIRRITGTQPIGVRLHWLYYDDQSPITLEEAGADYDSTIGYNETVGYRAGTSQAYKPFEATRLLELPLHIMDTALFYPVYLNLSVREAKKRVSDIIENAVQFGGAVTVNWHDRSIAPERCWDDFYVNVVDELRSTGAWFATAAEAVAWFRKRRATRFDNVNCESDFSYVNATADIVANLPPLHLQIHNPRELHQSCTLGSNATAPTGEIGLEPTMDTCVTPSVLQDHQ